MACHALTAGQAFLFVDGGLIYIISSTLLLSHDNRKYRVVVQGRNDIYTMLR